MKIDRIELDEVDLKLLAALQVNAAQPNQALATGCGVSPATSLRRVRRLKELGLIERTVALLQPDRLALALGHGLTAIVEVSLDQQGDEHLSDFEARACLEAAVQQVYRVSPGPDFVLVVAVHDMPAYLALAQQLFTAHRNVRHVKAYFSVKRSKFVPAQPLPPRKDRK